MKRGWIHRVDPRCPLLAAAVQAPAQRQPATRPPAAWMVAVLLGGALLVVAVLSGALLSGCADTGGAGPTSTAPLSNATTKAVPSPTAPAPESTSPSANEAPEAGGSGPWDATGPGSAGTRADPIPLGQTAVLGQWEVAVVESILDADDIVLNHSEFNPSPQPGDQFVLVKLRATRTTNPEGRFVYEVFAQFLGKGGTAYDEAFGDIPDPLAETGDAAPGESVTGYLLFEAPSSEVASGLLRLFTEALAPDDKAVFFALE